MPDPYAAPNQSIDFEQRFRVLEQRSRRLQWSVRSLLLGWVGTVLVIVLGAGSRSTPPSVSPDDVLTVRGVIVVDDNGIPRVQLGAPLPDPPVLGRRISRGGTAHGILLFDAEGNERGGYVTFDESGIVMLSLDEVARMVAQFAAGPRGGSRLWMRDGYGHNLRLGAYEAGPYLRLQGADSVLFLNPDQTEMP